jgi:hypothetical protein
MDRERLYHWDWGMALILGAVLGIVALVSLVQLILRYHAIGYALLGVVALVFVPYWVGRAYDKLV